MGRFTRQLCGRQRKPTDNLGWRGFADAAPSEAIQQHILPGLAVAVVFPHKPGIEVLSIPVKQYKDCKRPTKSTNARDLARWLTDERTNGLTLTGFVFANTQIIAAQTGLRLIEELPDTYVKPHYEGFRLVFGDGHEVDFAQAVALEYYFFAITFGILKASKKLPSEARKLFVAMDRFAGAGTNGTAPGQPLPRTHGANFLDFVRSRSKTSLKIDADNKSAGVDARVGTLDWWKLKSDADWKTGKSHPHFILADWLAEAALAHEFRGEFISQFAKHAVGVQAADGLEQLYQSYRNHDFLSVDAGVLQHLRASAKLWSVPPEARAFILDRARR